MQIIDWLNKNSGAMTFLITVVYVVATIAICQANIKSAKKRILVIETKTLRNKSIKAKVKTCIKNVEVAVAKGDKEAAQAALTVAISEISKATSKGIFHKNTAARKVSRLTKAVNGIA